ncbi:MAG TPA: hypothetical protein VGD91_26965 [Trebonia sp.]
MTESGTVFQPDSAEPAVPFRPRGAYVGFKAFGSGGSAVLLDPEVTQELRYAAEFATSEQRIAGGLLFGRRWADDEGVYLVVDEFLEAAQRPADAAGDFALAPADLQPLREHAARMYADSAEAGWWRTLGTLGDFGPADFATQAELSGPDGVGLLVYGSGPHWGTAYLGPDGHAPDTAGTLVAVPDDEPEDYSGAGAGPEPADEYRAEEPPPPARAVPPADRVPTARAPGTVLVPRPVLRPATQPTGTRMVSPIGVPAREWGVRPAMGAETPTDVKIVVAGLIIVPVIAAVMIGMLVGSATVALIAAVVFVLIVLGVIKMSRL